MRLGRRRVCAGVAIVVLVLAGPAWATLTLVTQWGSPGSADGQFNSPRGIAVNGAGEVYVADGNNNRIQKFGSDGAFISKFGGPGSADGQFNSPSGLALDPAGNVFVVDAGHYYVQVFRPDGTFIRRIGNLSSSPTPGPGEFDSNPEGIAVDGAGNVYVTDEHRVNKFTNDGTFIRAWGGDGSGDGQFSAANAVAIDRSGNVYVADGRSNTRVQKFDSDGRFLTKWGTFGAGDGQFGEPQGIAVRSDGHVFVGDDSRRSVQEFTSDGTFVARTTSVGPAPEQSFRPYGLAFGPTDDLFLTDIQPNIGNRVLRLRDVPAGPPPPVVNQTANAAPISGIVLIKPPAGASPRRYGLGPAQANGFIRLTEATQIPLGSLVDTKRGRVEMQTAVGTSRPGEIQKGEFYSGQFQVRQTGGSSRPVTEMVLSERLTCRSRRGRLQPAAARSRRLWGNGRGRFRTRGRYSTATVRGTQWLTKDTCTTTTTQVRVGTVVVRDLAKRRNVTVRAGRRYVARTRRR